MSVVVEGDIKPWRYPPSQEFLYGEWLRDTYELGGAPQPEPAPDLSILITMVLQGDAVLVGPPPAQLLDPVPHDDLIRGAIAGIPELLGDLESDTRNVLLTLARIWTTLQTGQSARRTRRRLGSSSSFRPSTNLSWPGPEPCTWMVRTRSAGLISPPYAHTLSTSSTPSDSQLERDDSQLRR